MATTRSSGYSLPTWASGSIASCGLSPRAITMAPMNFFSKSVPLFLLSSTARSRCFWLSGGGVTADR
jgi:hypothetical protein